MKRSIFSLYILFIILGLAIVFFIPSLSSPQLIFAVSQQQGGGEEVVDDGDYADYGDYDDYTDYDDYVCYINYQFDHWEARNQNPLGCGGEVVAIECDVNCGAGCRDSILIQCGNAQAPNINNGACQCSGQCYPAPEPKSVSSNALAPKNVFDDTKKLKRPINLGWSGDVNEWAQVNSIPSNQCTVESYQYELLNPSGTQVFIGQVHSPSSLPIEERVLQDVARGTQDNKEQCSALLPNQNYTWRVRACLDQQGIDCGSWGQGQSFTTSSAPELKSPFDPDWEREIDSAFSRLPVTLEWCPASGVNSWRLKLYQEKDIPLEEDLIKELILTQTFAKDKTTYPDAQLWRVIEKNIKYFWEIFPCTDKQEEKCDSTGSQFWSVLPSDTPLATPVLFGPPNGAVVNKLHQFSWQGDAFAHRYILRVEKEQKTPGDPFNIARYYPRVPRFSFSSLFGWENNKTYKWKVVSCWGTLDDTTGLTEAQIEEQIKTICETTQAGAVAWSEERQFITTGAAPTNLSIKQEGKNPDPAIDTVSIPLLLDWDDVKGAASYYYEVATDASFSPDTIVIPAQERVIQRSEASPGPPNSNITSNTNYWVRVKTCADQKGEICGSWSQIQVRTADLAPQQISTSQQGKGVFLSVAISAPEVFGAKAYKYFIKYLTPKEDEIADCKAKAGEVKEGIAHTSNFQVEAKCTGEYEARVQACLDKECKDTGPWSNTIIVPVIQCPGPDFGLVPCGLCRDFKNTIPNERDSCSVNHIFLMLRNIVDFALWKITLIVVVLMAAATGAILFFSFGGPEALVKIKAIWKAVGIGALILLFSWLLLNLLLGIVGFNVTVLGRWHEIPLQ